MPTNPKEAVDAGPSSYGLDARSFVTLTYSEKPGSEKPGGPGK